MANPRTPIRTSVVSDGYASTAGGLSEEVGHPVGVVVSPQTDSSLPLCVLTLGQNPYLTGTLLGPTAGGTGLDLSAQDPGILYGNGTAAGVLSLDGVAANSVPASNGANGLVWIIPSLSGHVHAASDITSGQLILEQGGTEADLSATGPGYLKQASLGAAITVDSLIDLVYGGVGADLSATGPGVLQQATAGAAVTVSSTVQSSDIALSALILKAAPSQLSDYLDDFSTYATGSLPAAWSSWDGSSPITVESFGGSNVLQIAGSGGTTGISAKSIAFGNAYSDIDYKVKVRCTGNAGFFLFAFSRITADTTYYYCAIGEGTTFFLRKRVGGITTDLASSTSFSWNANTWYWLRLECTGTTIRGKVWADGGAEPGAWTLSATDSEIAGPGYIGVRGSYTTAGTWYFDDVTVVDKGTVSPQTEDILRIHDASGTELASFGPAGRLTLPAGTATAGTAPLKFGSGGVVLATPEAQAWESTDTHAYWTNTAGTRYQLDQPELITVANEATDTTCFPLFVTAATGDLGPKTNAGFTLDSSVSSLGVTASDAVTAAATTTLTLGHNTSGTASTNFGTDLVFNMESSTTADTQAGRIRTYWSSATHASRAARLQFSVTGYAGEANGLVLTSQAGPVVSAALGSGASAAGVGAVAAAYAASAAGAYAAAIGAQATASGENAVCVGYNSVASGTSATAIGGPYNYATTYRALAMGQWAKASGTNAIAICNGWTDNLFQENSVAWSLMFGGYSGTTNAIFDQFKFCHNSTGTAAAGFGTALKVFLESSTTVDQAASSIETSWVTATHASRAAQVKFYVYDTAAREAIALEASGTAAKIGFLGAAAVVRPTALTTALTTITCSAPGTPDYAIADMVAAVGYGFASADEGQSVLKVIANLQTRIGELETKLQALGLLA